ncbi:hypothetical protein ABGB16_02280 [Micromonospora sp. B11E3]|uniref:hypothetical protein n=1 Tax=Micromonospora sp. B11E3 TaxID=3153562 RepID=UPI00325F5654
MTGRRSTPIGVGDIVEAPELHYCYGLGALTLRVIEVGRRERHSDGIWLNLRGVELGGADGPRQRRVLVRLDAVRVRPTAPSTEPTGPAGGPAPRPITDGKAHVPVRLSWDCAGCGEPWPCADRRRRLLVEYARLGWLH